MIGGSRRAGAVGAVQQPRSLHWLNRFAAGIDGALGSTATCLVLDTDTGVLKRASAGHVPPLIVESDGATATASRFLDGDHGMVLGVDVDAYYPEGRITLLPGTSVVIYTDGLVERRREIVDTGVERLAAITTAHRDLGPSELLREVLIGCLTGPGPDDDVALVIARYLPGAVTRRRQLIGPSHIRRVGQALRRAVRGSA